MKKLAADLFAADPRVGEARRLLLAALTDYQVALTGPRPPDPSHAAEYAEKLRAFGTLRGGELYYPYLGSGLGHGALVELADGSVKYDMISGIGVHYFGHGHPNVVAAAIDAALSDVVMQGNLQQDREAMEVTKLLLDQASAGGASLAHCLLTTSGAMANENALKLVFQRKHPASRLLAFEHCFAGRTLALSQITDKPAYRVGIPKTVDVDYVPFFDTRDPAGSTQRALAAVRQHIARYPKQHAAMMLELVQGEGGYHVGDRDFFLALMTELRAAGIATILDEVQTFGRTSRLYAFQHFGLDALVDVVTIGKLSQLCATLFTAEYKPQAGLLSQTFTASTASLFVGREIISRLISGNFFGSGGRIQEVHDRFVGHLKAIAQKADWISGPWGLGAMIAFTPFDGSADTVKAVLRMLFDEGVIAFLAGASPTRIRFLPPIGAVSDADIDAVCGILDRVLARCAGACRSSAR